jgi:hypothetical protein
MLNSNDILAPLGAKRGTSIWVVMLQIMLIFGLGMVPGFFEKLNQGISTYNLITVFFILVPIIVYLITKNRELKLHNVDATQKPIVIMTIPSNFNLLKKSLALSDSESNKKYELQEVYFLKTKGFPSQDIEKEIITFLKAYNIRVHNIELKNIENPREVQVQFKNILEKVDSPDNCAVNITSGQKTTSLFLYELARQHDIEVHYISSKYDKDNNPVDGTEKLTALEYEYLKEEK